MTVDATPESPAPAKLSTKAKLAGVLLSVVFFLLVLEAATRALFPIPKVLNFNRIEYSKMASIQSKKGPGAIRYLGNASYYWNSKPDGVENLHLLNLYGFRSSEWDFDAPTKERILFIGDSFIEGVLAKPDETISSAFEQKATETGEAIDVVRLGINGIGPTQYAQLIRDATPLFNPSKIVIVFFANDFPVVDFDETIFQKEFTPEFANPLLPRLLQLAANFKKRRTICFRWTSSPFNYSPAIHEPFNPIARDPLYSMTAFDSNLLNHALQGDYNPWLFNNLSRTKSRLKSPSNATPPLRAIHEFLKKKNVELSIVYTPSKYQISDSYTSSALGLNDRKDIASLLNEKYQRHARELDAICTELSIPFLDLTPTLQQWESEGLTNYWQFDDHMRPEGFTRTGEFIYQWMNPK